MMRYYELKKKGDLPVVFEEVESESETEDDN